MATQLTIHVNTDNIEALVEHFQQLSGIKKTSIVAMPSEKEFSKHYLFGNKDLGNTKPNLLFISQTQSDWITVKHNSFDILADWVGSISKKFKCRVIQIQGQSISEAYTLMIAEEGNIVRIIQVCHNDPKHKNINEGKSYDFEKIAPLELPIFDFRMIDKFCENFGLHLASLPKDDKWILLGGEGRKM